MPKKARPSPLAETIFREKLAELQSTNEAPDFSDLPVHNTFIQFGSPADDIEDSKERLRNATAPAWIGMTSFQSVANAAMKAATQTPPSSEATQTRRHADAATQTPPPSLPGTADSDASLGSGLWLPSPKKVPVAMRLEGASAASPVMATVPSAAPSAAASSEPAGHTSAEDAEEPPRRHAPRGPLAAPGEMPSIGSAKHNEGLCKRCCFFPKGRCTNGFNCEFCHLEHDKRKRKKKKKSKNKAQDSDDDDSDSGDEEQENKAPAADTKAAAATAQDAATAPAVANTAAEVAFSCQVTTAAANGLPTTAPPPLPPQLAAVPEAQTMPHLRSTYESFFSSPFDLSAASPAVGAAAPAVTPVAGAPVLADASARVPASPVQQQFIDPMGFGYASPGSPCFTSGLYCGSPLMPQAAPMSPPPPPAALLPPSLQGANAVQAGHTVQNVSVLPGVGLPAPR